MLHLYLIFLIVLDNNHVVLLLNHAPDQTQQSVYTISHIVIQQSPRLRNLKNQSCTHCDPWVRVCRLLV